VEGENGQGLTDGDYCVSPASAAYAFRGIKASMTFEKPVKADMVILYPGPEANAKGTLVINGAYETPIDLTGYADVPGGFQVIHFDAMDVTTLEMMLESQASLGEIIVLGNP
jgi:hypothetical protein